VPEESPDAGATDLDCQAMLYASGELDAEAAAAFEQRLGEDQAARDALMQAVQFNGMAAGAAPLAPNPAYRHRVQQRLGQRRRHLRKMAVGRGFFGQPAMWAALGAIVAVIAMVVFHHLSTFMNAPSTAPTPRMPGTQKAPASIDSPRPQDRADLL